MGGGGPLLLVRQDAVWQEEYKTCRFSMDRALLASDVHRIATIQAMQEKAINDLAKFGLVYMDRDWAIQGPLNHLIFLEDATVDPGIIPPPDPRKLTEQQLYQYQKVERKRAQAAKRNEPDKDLVDWRMATWFRFKTQALITKPSSLRGAR